MEFEGLYGLYLTVVLRETRVSDNALITSSKLISMGFYSYRWLLQAFLGPFRFHRLLSASNSLYSYYSFLKKLLSHFFARSPVPQ